MLLVELKDTAQFQRLDAIVSFHATDVAPGFDFVFVFGDDEDFGDGFELGFAEDGVLDQAEAGHDDDVLVVVGAPNHGYGAVGNGIDGSH